MPVTLPSPAEVQELRAARRTLVGVVPCRHSPEQLWPYFTQVDLYNRAAGSSAVSYEVIPQEDAASVIRATSRKVGFTMKYQEMPYEWRSPHFVQGELFFESGPLRYGRIRAECTEDGRGVRYVVDWVPRRRFSLAPLIAHGILRKFTSIIRGIDERLPDSFSDPLGIEGFADRSARALRLARELAGRWQSLARDAVIAETVADFVATAPDPFVGRMRPFALAQQLGTTRRETLEFCLRAARAGFLSQSWDLVCPSCGGAKKRAASIDELGSYAHCGVCNIRYDADLARNVEISFRPAPEVRRFDGDEYCLQSPSHQRRILAQVNLEPRGTVRIPLTLTPGHYRLRCVGREGEALFDSAYGRLRRDVEIDVTDRVARMEVSCGDSLEVVATNGSNSWRTVRFEHHGYREDAATAADVAALEEFRDSAAFTAR